MALALSLAKGKLSKADLYHKTVVEWLELAGLSTVGRIWKMTLITKVRPHRQFVVHVQSRNNHTRCLEICVRPLSMPKDAAYKFRLEVPNGFTVDEVYTRLTNCRAVLTEQHRLEDSRAKPLSSKQARKPAALSLEAEDTITLTAPPLIHELSATAPTRANGAPPAVPPVVEAPEPRPVSQLEERQLRLLESWTPSVPRQTKTFSQQWLLLADIFHRIMDQFNAVRRGALFEAWQMLVGPGTDALLVTLIQRVESQGFLTSQPAPGGTVFKLSKAGLASYQLLLESAMEAASLVAAAQPAAASAAATEDAIELALQLKRRVQELKAQNRSPEIQQREQLLSQLQDQLAKLKKRQQEVEERILRTTGELEELKRQSQDSQAELDLVLEELRTN